MRVFAGRIDLALYMAMERPHDADPRKHSGSAQRRHQDQCFHSRFGNAASNPRETDQQLRRVSPSITVAFYGTFWIHGQPWFEDRGRRQRRLKKRLHNGLRRSGDQTADTSVV
jgi:hypothetical protein